MVQMWGGGTTGYTDTTGYTSTYTGYTNPISGTTGFDLKYVSYLEEPLNAIQIKHQYLTSIKPQYDIVECQDDCVIELIQYITNGILDGDGDQLLTEDLILISF